MKYIMILLAALILFTLYVVIKGMNNYDNYLSPVATSTSQAEVQEATQSGVLMCTIPPEPTPTNFSNDETWVKIRTQEGDIYGAQK